MKSLSDVYISGCSSESVEVPTKPFLKIPFSKVQNFFKSNAAAKCIALSEESGPWNQKMAKRNIVVGIDDSEQSTYALEWVVDHLISSFCGNSPFKLILTHARPTVTSVLCVAGPGWAEALPLVENDLKKIAARVVEKAKAICESKFVTDFETEVVEGDARNVLCEAAEKHAAEILVVGSHGYGALKRAFLGSVSDYCAHHAKCTVMIVKKPHPSH